MTNLTRHEYEGLLAFAQAALIAERAQDWWDAAAELMLGQLLHADVVSVAAMEHRGRTAGTFVLVRPEWAERAVPTGSDMHVDLVADHPLTKHLRGERAAETVRVSDLVPLCRWRQMAGFAKMKELIGATNQMNVTVRADDSVTLSVSPIRTCSDFTEHELEVADHLKTLLQAADRHTRVLARLRESSINEPAVREAAVSHYGLTRREEVVLALLAEGLTTAAAARALRVSPRTVSKHQQNLYRKLQVSDRLAAVLLARRDGLIGGAPSHRLDRPAPTAADDVATTYNCVYPQGRRTP